MEGVFRQAVTVVDQVDNRRVLSTKPVDQGSNRQGFSVELVDKMVVSGVFSVLDQGTNRRVFPAELVDQVADRRLSSANTAVEPRAINSTAPGDERQSSTEARVSETDGSRVRGLP